MSAPIGVRRSVDARNNYGRHCRKVRRKRSCPPLSLGHKRATLLASAAPHSIVPRLRPRTPGRIIEGRQILLHSAAGALRIAIPAPILTRDRALLVGIGLDQARIDCKAFTANQTGRDACLDDTFEHAAKNIPLAETLIAGARKCRVVRDSVLDTELAESAIAEVHLHFTTDQPERKDIPHDEHPDH